MSAVDTSGTKTNTEKKRIRHVSKAIVAHIVTLKWNISMNTKKEKPVEDVRTS